MSREQGFASLSSRPTHLPPTDYCSSIYRLKPSRVSARYHLVNPTDEYGIPDVDSMVKTLGSMMHKDYVWPEESNIHHLAYYRRSYMKAGPVAYEFREGPAMRVRMPRQAHNLYHEVFGPNPMTPMDIMRQRNEEQHQVTTLFRLGQLATRFGRWADMIEEYLPSLRPTERVLMGQTALYYSQLASFRYNQFCSYAEKCKESEVGLMPNPEMLVSLPVGEATALLGRIGAVGCRDIRRALQDAVVKYGFE